MKFRHIALALLVVVSASLAQYPKYYIQKRATAGSALLPYDYDSATKPIYDSLSSATLQRAYNKSTAPQITTNGTRGALVLQRGSTSDNDSVLTVRNGAGATVFKVTGTGGATSALLTGSGARPLYANAGGLIGDTTATDFRSMIVAEPAISAGTTSQYWRGDKSWQTLPTSFPPNGSAGGDLSGAYPNPTLGAVGTAGTYKSVTTDSKGRVISGSNPTTLSGYGITDARFNVPTVMTNGNVNAKITNGVWAGYNVTNAPNNGWGVLNVWRSPGDSGDQVWQEWREAIYLGGAIYVRGSTDYGATWTSWKAAPIASVVANDLSGSGNRAIYTNSSGRISDTTAEGMRGIIGAQTTEVVLPIGTTSYSRDTLPTSSPSTYFLLSKTKKSLPANFWTAGKTLLVKYAIYSTYTTIGIGGHITGTSNIATLTANLSQLKSGEIQYICISTGSSGRILVKHFNHGESDMLTFTGTATVNTTDTTSIGISAQSGSDFRTVDTYVMTVQY